MRDPDRIPEVLRMLETAWKQYPDMRLGQLVIAAASMGGRRPGDPFYTEEPAMMKGLAKLIERGG